MKFPPIYAALVFAGLMAGAVQLSGQSASPVAAKPAVGPKLEFPTNEYDFGKVVTGTLVKHVFIVSNAGDQALEITQVRPGCHCTTAGDWTHHLEPGQTGQIPIQLNSAGMMGNVTRAITVTSNDKMAPRKMLTMRGSVWRAFTVNPQYAVLRILPDPGSTSSTVIHITSEADAPVELSNPTCGNHAFNAELKAIKPGKEYELTISAVSKVYPGNNNVTVTVHTSLPEQPSFDVLARADLVQTVDVSPLQIVLPSRLDRWLTNRISITNNSAAPLNLSDVTYCCDKSVMTQLQVTAPGRGYTVLAIFPPGFETPSNQLGQLSVKTDNAGRPAIVVPVRQFHPRVMPAPSKPVSQNSPPLQAASHP